MTEKIIWRLFFKCTSDNNPAKRARDNTPTDAPEIGSHLCHSLEVSRITELGNYVLKCFNIDNFYLRKGEGFQYVEMSVVCYDIICTRI